MRNAAVADSATPRLNSAGSIGERSKRRSVGEEMLGSAEGSSGIAERYYTRHAQIEASKRRINTMQTRSCKQFGIEFPVFAFTHCRDGVAAALAVGAEGAWTRSLCLTLRTWSSSPKMTFT
jgi:hypothetical protein